MPPLAPAREPSRPPALDFPTRRLTEVRRAHPAKPPTPTTSIKRPMPTVVTAVDAYAGVVRCPSPIPLDEPPYTTLKEENSCLSRFEPPVAPPTKPSKRPPIQRGPSSNLVTRWSRVDVPDSVLISELEELRRNVELTNENSPSDDHGSTPDFRCNSCIYGPPSQDDDRKWKKAQRSAFCRRELIKTELTYLEGVLQLENKNVSQFHQSISNRNAYSLQCRSPPPALLLAYLPALTAASCQLLDRFLSDPTAEGVSLAFVDSEQQLEEALVPWCSVIGSAFSNNPSRSRSTGSIGPRKLIKQARQISAFDRWKSSDLSHACSTIPSPRAGSNGNTVTNVFRRLSRSSTGPSRPMSSQNSSTGSLISNSTHSSECHTSSPPSLRDCNLEDLPCKLARQRESHPRDPKRYLSCTESSRPREPLKVSSFRELAILPTQRVTRYVLLFRGEESWL